MHFIISIPIILIVLLFLAVISFLLSASETSIIGLSRIRLRHMIAQGVKHASHIQRLMLKLDKLITAILIANNFVSIAISSILTAIFVQLFGFSWGVLISTFVATFCILVFCEITPKILATRHTEKVALAVAPVMEGLIKILDPIIRVFIGISAVLLKILRIGPMKRSPLITEEELRMMIEIGKEEGVLSDEEKKMLHRIFEFGDTRVQAVMVPKDKIIAVNSTITSEELLNIFVEEGHARLPVYAGSIDNMVGVVYARDLLYILRDKSLFVLKDLIHEAYYVNPSTQVNEVLRKFQADKNQIAIVVDDHKKAVGMVTLEDLLEEIVGELEEKHQNHTHAR